MTHSVVKPLERKVLRDTVYDSLVDMLMSGSLAPGEPLSIDGLASELQVSPTPVREALVHLERTGLVSRAPLRGYRVAPPLSAEQVSQLFDARLILELGALDLAFENAATLAVELAKAQERHERAAVQVAGVAPEKASVSAYRAYMDADWSFHHAIFRYSHNAYLLSMADALPAHLHRLRQSVTRGVQDSELAVGEHALVLHAVRQGDQASARQALHDHIVNVKGRSLRDEHSAAS